MENEDLKSISKYKIEVYAKYTKGVYVCPHCGNDMLDRFYSNAKGFKDSHFGLMLIIECDKCFENFCSHGIGQIPYFLENVAKGKNKFFKPDEAA